MHIPAGCDIGMNPAVIGYNEDIFGPDVYDFQPTNGWERLLLL
jgi:hypothetical protein